MLVLAPSRLGDRRGDGGEKQPVVERLGKIGGRARRQAARTRLRRVMRGDDHHGDRVFQLADAAQDLLAAHDGDVQVEHDAVRAQRADTVEELRATREGLRLHPRRAQQAPERIAHRFFVVHYGYERHSGEDSISPRASPKWDQGPTKAGWRRAGGGGRWRPVERWRCRRAGRRAPRRWSGRSTGRGPVPAAWWCRTARTAFPPGRRRIPRPDR